MFFKSKYMDRRFFSKNSRDFFDEGYYYGLTYRKEIDKKIEENLNKGKKGETR
jgi:hypothetical protein